MNAAAASNTRPPRVLVAKPGLDGHDVGARIVVRALRDAGMEVIYTGLRQSPEAIAAAAADEDVDVVGLSILSGAHLPLVEKTVAALESKGAGDVLLLVGGNIPKQDEAALKEMGVGGIFATGSAFDDMAAFISEHVTR